jgi:pilus assembly protein CpaE
MSTPHILLVEDSEITLFKLKAILTRLGYTVTAQTNPISALDWLKKSGTIPSLIISDVQMPGMSGYDFVRQARTMEITAHTPILMLTSQVGVEDKIAGLQAGADDYLGKTVTPTELELRVKALLSRSETLEGTFTQAVAKTITVFSLRGGVGTTSIAINLSIALNKLWGIDVCLWDLALSGGLCAFMLKLNPHNSLVSLSGWNEATVDDHVIQELLVSHESGIKLFPAPITAAESELITSKVIDLAWPYLQGNSNYLVIDGGNHFTDPLLTVLERSDVVLLTLAPEMASIKAASDALRILDKLSIDPRKVVLVINNIFLNHRLPVKKIVPVLNNHYAVEIPYDGDGFLQAIMTGNPLISMSPKSEASMAITKFAYTLSMKEMETNAKVRPSPFLEGIRKLMKTPG